MATRTLASITDLLIQTSQDERDRRWLFDAYQASEVRIETNDPNWTYYGRLPLAEALDRIHSHLRLIIQHNWVINENSLTVRDEALTWVFRQGPWKYTYTIKLYA